MMEFLLSNIAASAGASANEASTSAGETQRAGDKAQQLQGETPTVQGEAHAEPATTRGEVVADHPNRLEMILHCLAEEHARHQAEDALSASADRMSALTGEKMFRRSPAAPAS